MSQDSMTTLFKVLDLSDTASCECCQNTTIQTAERLEKTTDMAMQYLIRHAEVLYNANPTEKKLKTLNRMKAKYMESCK